MHHANIPWDDADISDSYIHGIPLILMQLYVMHSLLSDNAMYNAKCATMPIVQELQIFQN